MSGPVFDDKLTAKGAQTNSPEIETVPALPDYADVTKILNAIESMMPAAEVHGMLCGFICAGQRMNGKAWFESVLHAIEPHHGMSGLCRDMLLKLHEISHTQIRDIGFDFQLLLPDEDASLAMRAQAVGQWCQGFLGGLGFAGIQLDETEYVETQDILSRMVDIAQIDYQGLDFSEQDEKAFFEVSEYVRMGVLMVYTELVAGADGMQGYFSSESVH